MGTTKVIFPQMRIGSYTANGFFNFFIKNCENSENPQASRFRMRYGLASPTDNFNVLKDQGLNPLRKTS